MEYNKKYPLTNPTESKTSTIFEIGLITDLDKDAKVVQDGNTVWKSLLRKGTLVYDYATRKVDITLQNVEAATTLISEYSIGGRGMELSELVVYNGELYTVDDRTGIVFHIVDGKAVPWAILSDGNGKERGGFKGEWMSMKDEKLYVGGHGRELMSRDGKSIVNKNYQWVKILNQEGAVVHENWASHYDAMRAAAGCEYPGYLVHESGVWSEKHKQWFFLPRKVSKEPYHYKLDEKRAGNIMLRCSADFSDIQVVKIGELKHNTRGFSTFKFIPGTEDSVILAIKSEEVDDAQRSFLFVFTVDGEILMDDKEFSTTMKYEGIEFI
ncbi:soluble calcium-activated nucleotidase 1-like [Styela clava]